MFVLLNGRDLGPWHTVVGPDVILYVLNGFFPFFMTTDVPGAGLLSG
jgi:hypothetical protein